MRRLTIFAVCAAASLLALARSAPAAGAEVGPASDVAPKAEGARIQMWAHAAWAAEAKCWLVAWREGDITSQESDVWCARVGADGKAMDPAGIRLTAAKDMQSHPRVASDGKGWLVVWQDFRNGKDYDVYAARVSGEGKPLDPEGIQVAGGPHNQAMPDLAFAGGCYQVVWQGYTANQVKNQRVWIEGGYNIFGARVSPEGKILDAQPAQLDGADPKATCCWFPAVAGDGRGALLAGLRVDYGGWMHEWSLCARLVGGTGGPAPAAFANTGMRDTKGRGPGSYTSGQRPALAGVEGNYLIAYRGGQAQYGNQAVFCRLGKDGKVTGPSQVAIEKEKGMNAEAAPIAQVSAAFDGSVFLVTLDYGESNDTRKYPLQVRGQFLSENGEIVGGEKTGFPIAKDAAKQEMLGWAAAGPKGTFLVVNSEVRGADDVKVVARLVKVK